MTDYEWYELVYAEQHATRLRAYEDHERKKLILANAPITVNQHYEEQ